MLNEIKIFLETMRNNKGICFDEFNQNRGDMTFESVSLPSKSYVVKDINGIYSTNTALVPELNTLISSIGGGLNIMSITYYEGFHPRKYFLNWDDDYAVKRYYIISNSDDIFKLKHPSIENSTSELSFFQHYLTEEDASSEVSMSGQTKSVIYITIDIWEGSEPPTAQQRQSYYDFYKLYVSKQSNELQNS